MKASKVLIVLVLLDAFVMAYGHAPLALGISSLFRPQGRQPPSPSPSSQTSARSALPFFAIGAYFLFATVVYILGGIFVATGKLFKLANIGLIALAVVDNALLVYTRAMPSIFFGREIPWSWGWFPLGTVQVLIGQIIIVVICAAILYKPTLHKAQQT